MKENLSQNSRAASAIHPLAVSPAILGSGKRRFFLFSDSSLINFSTEETQVMLQTFRVVV